MQTRSSDKHCFHFLGWSSKQGEERDFHVEVTVRFHKADVIYHGKTLMSSKRCHSWRPEANLRFDGDILAQNYFGMGAQESTGLTYDLVLFTRRLSILRAVVQVLEEDVGVQRYRGDVKHKTMEQATAMALSVEDSYANSDARSTASEMIQVEPSLETEVFEQEVDYEPS